MTSTTYYNLNIVEGTDIVNPLIVDNPNYEKIDEAMHNNAVAGVTLATEIANATVHAITRENSDCAVIRFIATSQWKAGDTATVDGVPVTALLPSGETLPDGAYVINANVLCILTGTNLTVYLGSKKAENANEVSYKDTNVEAELDKLNASIQETNTSLQETNTRLQETNSNLNTLLNIKIGVEENIGKLGDKPLYRKVIYDNGVNISTGKIIDSTLKPAYVDSIYSINGYYKHVNSKYPFGMINSSAGVSVFCDDTNNGLIINPISRTVTEYMVIIEYTKS